MKRGLKAFAENELESQKFDDMIRSIGATRVTRLTALRGLAAGAAAAVAGVSLATAGEAGKNKSHHKHSKKKGSKKHARSEAKPGGGGGGCTGGSVTYRGQGLFADDFGGYDLQTELCGVENGADTDGPYLLWVFTATGATSAAITGPWGTANMTKSGNGTFKYISGWYDPDALVAYPVSATYAGCANNPQLVISHGCRPFTKKTGAFCSPGFWGRNHEAWEVLENVSLTETTFNTTVYDAFWGDDPVQTPYDPDVLVSTVVVPAGSTYKTPASAGTDSRTQHLFAGTYGLTPFNAAGAFLSDHIPGYTFDPDIVGKEGMYGCPLDAHGNFKCCTDPNSPPCPQEVIDGGYCNH